MSELTPEVDAFVMRQLNTMNARRANAAEDYAIALRTENARLFEIVKIARAQHEFHTDSGITAPSQKTSLPLAACPAPVCRALAALDTVEEVVPLTEQTAAAGSQKLPEHLVVNSEGVKVNIPWDAAREQLLSSVILVGLTLVGAVFGLSIILLAGLHERAAVFVALGCAIVGSIAGSVVGDPSWRRRNGQGK